MSSLTEAFIEEIEEKISYVQKTTALFNSGDNITPEQINSVLANHYGVSTWLLKQYEIEMLEGEALKQEYKIWYSEKLLLSRKNLNVDRPSSKLASASEIEADLIVSNASSYKEWQDKLLLEDRKVSFYRRLQENWDKVLNIAITFSSNSRSEMRSLNIERIYNKPKKIPLSK